MSIASEVQAVIDKFHRVQAQRRAVIEAFHTGGRPFLVHLDSPCTFYKNCNFVEQSFQANLFDFAAALDFPSDSLPFMEPWFGTGVYAEAFGCEYFWRENDSPACHYRYHTIDEIRSLTKPDLGSAKVRRMVLDAITVFLERTDGQLPICLTDTQSPHDNATLILDAVEVFTASYSDPEPLHDFCSSSPMLSLSFPAAKPT